MTMAALRCDDIVDQYKNPKGKELFLFFADENTEQNLSRFKTQGFMHFPT